MSLESLKVQIIKKAWEDPAFKAALLSEPKKAIQEAFDIEIPAEVELKVVEEKPSLYYLVLPQNPEDAAGGNSGVQFVW
ncbi:NHLP leader peptide family RiPP precursor [Cohnella nanjingensis]|uniref:NHLP leader peptide family natural product n=1 Tax=Cohnella nanjingensis TaxID=1387779 RepID=A0A7X0RQZ1_9BACL|nr:NHLP leader peptide family RiPP precursor [Cohnella nanjingensis]MBB6672048.1 NHLP leader peptide family natural product precursor [Cohnella nanjingensis]